MQAGRELVRRVDHRAVIAEIARAGFRVFGDDDAARDVSRSIGIEMLEHRQRGEIDSVVGDLVEHGTAFNDSRCDRPARTRLVSFVEATRRRAEEARDARARSKNIGRDFDRDSLDVFEM